MSALNHFFAFLITLLLATFSNAQTTENLCLTLSDNFCNRLYSAENQGNLGSIKLGRTQNDIKYSKFFFLQAVEKSFKNQAADVQYTLKKNNIIQRINRYINRKPRQQATKADIYKPEWTSDTIDEIKIAFEQLAVVRTEKKQPGYIRQLVKDTAPATNMEYYRELDLIWADFFKNVWKDQPAWKEVEKKFEIVRAEYIEWNKEDKTVSEELRKFRHEQLTTLELIIPGSSRNRAYDNNFNCGIDEDNAYYNSQRHQLTVCAGGFVSDEPLLTIAHEVGHSISNTRRVYKYFESSPFGKNFSQLWFDIQKGNHLTCEKWDSLKKDMTKDLENLKPYTFEDEKFLSRFISKELRPIPNEAEFSRITNRLAKRTLNSEIRNNMISRVIKKTEVLESGRSIPNPAYLNPEALIRWSLIQGALFSPSAHFDHFFVQEYNCLLNEKKLADTTALEQALLEARNLTGTSWKALLKIAGRFSFFNDAIDEDFAQDIEEDVVDSYASTVVARILKKIDSIEKRRELYFNSTASYCDPISFRQLYPAETNVMHKLTNALHSVGQDRRKKLLTEDVKPLLNCN